MSESERLKLWLVCTAIEQAMKHDLQTPNDYEDVARCLEKQAKVMRSLGDAQRERARKAS